MTIIHNFILIMQKISVFIKHTFINLHSLSKIIKIALIYFVC